MTRIMALAGFILLSFAMGPAQAKAPDPLKGELKSLAFLIGEWRGDGRLFLSDDQSSFVSMLHIAPAVDGAYLIFDETITAPGADGAPHIVHQSHSVVRYDAAAKAFRTHAFFSNGVVREWTAAWANGKYIETISPSPFNPGATARFTSARDAADKWSALGEQSTDGKTWTKVLETKYTRAATR